MADHRHNAETRIVGMMFGAAVGDAVGLYTENFTANEAQTHYPSGRFKLDSTGQNLTDYYPDDHRSQFDDGSWTDDTDMALCVLLAYLETGGVDHLEIAARFRDWRYRGLSPLLTFAPGIDPHNEVILGSPNYLIKDQGGPLDRAITSWVAVGAGDVEGFGKGAIMRTHPLGAILGNRPLHEVLEAASLITQVTHMDPRCAISALIVTIVTRGLIRGEITTTQDLDRMMQTAVRWYLAQEYEEETTWYPLNSPRRAELSRIVTAASLAELKLGHPQTPEEQRSGGHTYKPLGAAIHCLRVAMTRLAQVGLTGPDLENTRRFTFEDLINEVAMQGGDASTNTSVAGALLGAYLRYDAIPAHWNRGLRNRQFLLSNSRSLCMALQVIPGNYVFPSTPIFNQATYTSVLGDPDDAEVDQRKAAANAWKDQRIATLRQRRPL